MTEPTSAPTVPLKHRLFEDLAGLETFNLFSLVLSSLVFSLAKLTVYAADASYFILYSVGALAISQSAVIVLLAISGMVLKRAQLGKLQVGAAVGLILGCNILGTFLFEAILRSWNQEPLAQSLFQRAISLSFATFTYLGLGWITHLLSGNLKQVNSAKELLISLSKQQLILTGEIREARTFATREVSLEIQSTRGSLDSFIELNHPSETVAIQINQLQETLDEVESRIGRVVHRFPSSTKTPRAFSQIRYSVWNVLAASTKPNNALPIVISVVAFFGFSSWLSYFMAAIKAFCWGAFLSAASYVIFRGYEKYLVPRLSAKPLLLRILIYELIVLTYLFFWLFILGFFAGDNSGAYGAALAYAVIPFIFFNCGALMGGVITSSQEHRENLTKQAHALRKEMTELVQIRTDEDRIWKSLFAGDIAISPTTASVILRDAILSKENERVVQAIPNVTALWKSVLAKLPKVS